MIFIVTWLNGCAIPKARPESSTRDKAFIEYWPQSNDSKKLRLAVKDLIDMKGVVTTAGSEFLAKHASPQNAMQNVWQSPAKVECNLWERRICRSWRWRFPA